MYIPLFFPKQQYLCLNYLSSRQQAGVHSATLKTYAAALSSVFPEIKACPEYSLFFRATNLNTPVTLSRGSCGILTFY